MNTEMEKQNGTELIQTLKLEGTPFAIVKQEGLHFLTMGRFQISEPMEQEEMEKYIKENQWNLVARIAGIIAEAVVEQERRRKYENGPK